MGPNLLLGAMASAPDGVTWTLEALQDMEIPKTSHHTENTDILKVRSFWRSTLWEVPSSVWFPGGQCHELRLALLADSDPVDHNLGPLGLQNLQEGRPTRLA